MEVSSLVLLHNSTQVVMLGGKSPYHNRLHRHIHLFFMWVTGIEVWLSSLQGKHFYLLSYLDSFGHSILKL